MEKKRYLDKLIQGYDYLKVKYQNELDELCLKIEKEKYYYHKRLDLINIIYDFYHKSDDYDETEQYKNPKIRGGYYTHVSEYCPYKDSEFVVYFSYEYNDSTYSLYIYDDKPLVYKNYQIIQIELCKELKPIFYLLDLLDYNAKNYEGLHKKDQVFRWGNPEQYGVN